MQSQVYYAVTMNEVVKQQNHLDKEQRKKLKEVLDNHTILFKSELERYLQKKFTIIVEEGMKAK